MSNAFTALLTYITNGLIPFFLSEPVVYFVGAFMLIFVIALVARLFRRDF